MKSIPKPFTTARIFFDLMSNVYKSGAESDITDLTNFHGEPIARSSISMYVNKISKERFPGASFYTRTIKTTGRIVIGCYNPALCSSDSMPGIADKQPHSPDDTKQYSSSAYNDFMAALEQ